MTLNMKRKETGENIAVGIILVAIALTISMLSPIDFISPNGVDYTDSSVFRYMARVMDKGGLPYKDSFDHKGILLYFINWIGLKISYQHGVWFVQLIFMLFSVWGAYRLSRLVAGKVQSILTVLVVFALMTSYFQGGNLTEDYALPLQIWSLYIFMDYFMNAKISKVRLMICGACLSAVCFLRINMIPVWVTFCIFALIRFIRKKQYKELFKFATWFLLGFMIVAAPICVYLISHGIWGDFFEDYWVFNRLYSHNKVRANGMTKFKAAVNFLNNQTIWIAIVFSIFHFMRSKDKEDRTLNCVYFGYIAMNILLICLSGQVYFHYGMILMPMLVFPYAKFLGEIHISEIKAISASSIAAAYVMVTLVCPSWSNMVISVTNDVINHTVQEDAWSDTNYQRMIEYIDSVTTKEDLISVYGNEVSIYNVAERFSASKYAYQKPISDINGEILDEYYEELDENNVRLIVMSSEPDERMSAFMREHSIVRTQSFGSHTVYVKLPPQLQVADAECSANVRYVDDISEHLDRMIESPKGGYLYSTDIEKNRFNSIQIQVLNLANGEYLSTIYSTSETGKHIANYQMEYPSGYYLIRLKANSNFKDEYVEYAMYMEQGAWYYVSFSLESIHDKNAVVSDFVLYSSDS